MVALFQVTLSGWSGGGGINTWAFSEAGNYDQARTVLSGFYDGIKDDLAPGVRWNFDGAIRVYDTGTGTIQNIATALPFTGTASSSTGGNENRASQIKCQLITTVVANRHLIRGGVFVGPLGNNAIGPDGGINTERIPVWENLLELLNQNTELCVWHRPVNKAGGVLAPVVSTSIMPKPAVLRSRRD